MNKAIVGYISIVMCLLSLGACAENQNPGLGSVKDIQQHEDNIYSSGQPEPGIFAEFARQGVTDVINLRSHGEMKTIAEEAAVSQAGMQYHHIAVADIEDLNRDNVEQLHQLLAQAGNRNTLIHCKSSNRVGALMALRAAWLQDMSAVEALAIGKAYGLSSLEPDVKKILGGS